MAGILKVDRVQSDSNLAFQIGSANVAYFDVTDGVKLGSTKIGSSSISTNGIAFPATQVPSADANTLDDYEEGTWSPTIGAASSMPTVTYSGQGGKYTKVGNVVHFVLFVAVASISGGSGSAYITLPFSSIASDAYGYVAVTAWHSNVNHSGTVLTPLIWNNTSIIYLTGSTDNAAYAQTPISGIGVGTEFRLSGSYFVA